MIQLQISGRVLLPDRREIKLLRERYRRQTYLRLPHFVDDALLKHLQNWVGRSRFRDDHRPAYIGGTFSTFHNRLAEIFLLLLNDPGLLKAMEKSRPAGLLAALWASSTVTSPTAATA